MPNPASCPSDAMKPSMAARLLSPCRAQRRPWPQQSVTADRRPQHGARSPRVLKKPGLGKGAARVRSPRQSFSPLSGALWKRCPCRSRARWVLESGQDIPARPCRPAVPGSVGRAQAGAAAPRLCAGTGPGMAAGPERRHRRAAAGRWCCGTGVGCAGRHRHRPPPPRSA